MKKTTKQRAFSKRPLELDRETIRHLSGPQLAEVIGGAGTTGQTGGLPTTTCPTFYTCNPTRTDVCTSTGFGCTSSCPKIE